MLIFNAILLLILDVYIFYALRATKIKFARSKWFPYLWWGYSAALFLGLFIATMFTLPLAVRSILLVTLFMTAVTTFIYLLIILADDIRRGAIWLMRLFSYRGAKPPSERRELLKEP